MTRLDKFVCRRNEIAQHYNNALEDTSNHRAVAKARNVFKLSPLSNPDL